MTNMKADLFAIWYSTNLQNHKHIQLISKYKYSTKPQTF